MKVYAVLFLIKISLGLTLAEIKNENGFCHVTTSENSASCKQEGKYKVSSFAECCENGTAAGYSHNSSGIKAIKDFFLKRKETACQSCADSFNKKKKWCFAYRNNVDGFCVHIPRYSTLEASSEYDCSLWWNATGFTEAPKWKWSNSYSRWTTPCSKLVRNKLVACFQKYVDVPFIGSKCSNFLPRYAESPVKCCSQSNVTGYAWMEKNNRGMTDCNACPVHGGWSEWSAWSPCSTTCGHSVKRRVRECSNPMPKYGGNSCSGNKEESKNCDVISTCPESVATISTALTGRINDNWSQWSSFSPCSVTCGSGFMERKRTCPNVFVNCEGVAHEVHRCDTPVECRNVGVNWIWTDWSPCHKTCGAGIRLRSKLCLIVDDAVGSECSADVKVEMNNCDLPPCNLTIIENNPQLRIAEPGTSVTPWVIPLVIISVLLSGLVFVFVYKRKAIIRKRSKLTDVRKSRKPPAKRLPSIPPSDPSEGYVPMTIIDQSVNITTKCECGRISNVDKDGYEIPKDNDISSSSLNSDGAIDHVYEQLTFYQDVPNCVAAPMYFSENVEQNKSNVR